MFSGIVECLAEVKGISRRGNLFLLEIKPFKRQEDAEIGESIAINGACLTLIGNKQGVLGFEVMPQTWKCTNLSKFRIGERINFECALKVGQRLSGHFVAGHIDCLGVIRHKKHVSGNLCFEIAVPMKFMRCVLPKGSIAVDGISLTVVDIRSNVFSIYIIPHTLQNTTLQHKGSSDTVNIEFDIITKR